MTPDYPSPSPIMASGLVVWLDTLPPTNHWCSCGCVGGLRGWLCDARGFVAVEDCSGKMRQGCRVLYILIFSYFFLHNSVSDSQMLDPSV